MNTQIFSLALWMFFGFVLIKAIDSILSFLVNAYFHLGIWQEWSVLFLTYSIPVLSFCLYLSTILLSIKYLNEISINFGFQKIKFPIILYSLSVFIAIILNPLQNKLTGLYAQTIFSTDSIYDNEDLLSLYGITNASTAICAWVSIIVLSIYFYRTYRKSEIISKN